jgi:hypothetical protein
MSLNTLAIKPWARNNLNRRPTTHLLSLSLSIFGCWVEMSAHMSVAKTVNREFATVDDGPAIGLRPLTAD